MSASKKHQIETIHRQFETFVGDVNGGTVNLVATHEDHPDGGATIYFDQDALAALSLVITAARSVAKAMQACGLEDLEGEH